MNRGDGGVLVNDALQFVAGRPVDVAARSQLEADKYKVVFAMFSSN
jgi:hypothetical protein